jgi:hypothetical protein
MEWLDVDFLKQIIFLFPMKKRKEKKGRGYIQMCLDRNWKEAWIQHKVLISYGILSLSYWL